MTNKNIKNKPGQSSSYLLRRLKIPKNEVPGSKALGTAKIQNGKISEGCTKRVLGKCKTYDTIFALTLRT